MKERLTLPDNLLLKEVHHRMKNHMSTLVGLFTLQCAQSDDDRVKSALAEASSRATSMMVLYDRLYQQKHVHRLELARYLPTLVKEIVQLFACCNDVDVRTRVDEGSVSARQAQPLTLLVNEIVTNSMKHAFTGHEDQRLDLEFSHSPTLCVLRVSDNGGQTASRAPERSGAGFGMELMDMLVQQLKGTLEITRNEGTTVTVRFPPED